MGAESAPRSDRAAMPGRQSDAAARWAGVAVLALTLALGVWPEGATAQDLAAGAGQGTGQTAPVTKAAKGNRVARTSGAAPAAAGARDTGGPAGLVAGKGDLAPPAPPDPFAAFAVIAAEPPPNPALSAALRNKGATPSPGPDAMFFPNSAPSDEGAPTALALVPPGVQGVAIAPDAAGGGFTAVPRTGRRTPAAPPPAAVEPAPVVPPPSAPEAEAPDIPQAYMPELRPPRPVVAEALEQPAVPVPVSLPAPRPAIAEAAIVSSEEAPPAEARPQTGAAAAVSGGLVVPVPAARPRLPGTEIAALPGTSVNPPTDTLPGSSLTALPGTQELKGVVRGLPAACAAIVAKGIADMVPSEHKQSGGACRVPDLVKVSSFRLADGREVEMTPPAHLNCHMATEIVAWMRSDIAPAIAKLGSPLAAVKVADSYDCRPQNRQRGNRLSEHGRGNAMDVGGYVLANGRSYAVGGRSLPASFRTVMRASACARFETVLGPGSDGYHEEHIHVDLANRRRAWAACRWKITDAAGG